MHHALAGHRTLIVTTDPASNLADVYEQEIGPHYGPDPHHYSEKR
ncbi:MAG: hypothetical protein NTV33_06370 [Coprothermobacterota bacterium]|nr:hypothetical protein [Coprothermobacterota bacterium]